MTAIVCNTGPMIALAGIERLDILRGLYESVYLPQAVHDEILHGGRHFTGLDAYRKADWITISALQQPGDPLLATVLDVGEASVIQLAREIGVHRVLMDERKGRRVADGCQRSPAGAECRRVAAADAGRRLLDP
jgi:predicted nucleic acid-binding protein